ncbi:MAG: SirB2 family protein [Sedimenticola sp.]|nr:SirB2 family protein [Sedimenticola sp.]
MLYYWIKELHVATVVFTVSFFSIRLIWMYTGSRLVNRPWVRRLSQANDSLLLVAGITLAVMSHQYPLVMSWLTAKLAVLILYIILGMFALRWAPTRNSRLLFGVLALASVGYIVAVALTRTPQPWQAMLG